MDVLKRIQTCVWRIEGTDWEPGLALDGGDRGVIDRFGNIVCPREIRMIEGISVEVYIFLSPAYVLPWIYEQNDDL